MVKRMFMKPHKRKRGYKYIVSYKRRERFDRSRTQGFRREKRKGENGVCVYIQMDLSRYLIYDDEVVYNSDVGIGI
jgi:hypothetical protein